MNSALDILKRNWFIAGIALIIALGLTAPQSGLLLAKLKVSGMLVALIMLLNGLTLTPQNFWGELRNFRALLASLSLVYLVAPLLVWLLAVSVFARRPESQLGLALLAAQSSTLASGIVITGIARGNTALALIVTLTNTLLSAWLTPLLLWVWLRGGLSADFSLWIMIRQMLLVALLPVALGQLARAIFPAQARAAGKYSSTAAQICILLLMLIGVSHAAERLRANWAIAPLLLFSLAGLHLLLLGISAIVGKMLRLDVPAIRALTFCSSQKTMPAGVYIAQTWFPGQPLAALPLILYHVLQILIDSLIAARMAKRIANHK